MKDTGRSLLWIVAGVLVLVFVAIPLLPSLGDAAVSATGKAAADASNRLGDGAYTVCKTVVACLGSPSGLDRDPTATTPSTISDDEMAARQQAKAVGDALPPIRVQPPAPSDPPRPTLGGSGSTGGILGALPGPIGEAARALGSGQVLKALNP